MTVIEEEEVEECLQGALFVPHWFHWKMLRFSSSWYICNLCLLDLGPFVCLKDDFDNSLTQIKWQFTSSFSEKNNFLSKKVYKTLVFKSLGAEVHEWRVDFVEQNIHQPSKEEGQPANHNHHPDLELCQWMKVSIHINQPHTVR